jgi:hypothetical protein
MRSIDATKLDRKSGGSRGTCCAPFLNATVLVSAAGASATFSAAS